MTSDNVAPLRRFVDVEGRYANPSVDAPASDPSLPVASHQLDALVDRVVERIEQRVVDELERRGRRTGGY